MASLYDDLESPGVPEEVQTSATNDQAQDPLPQFDSQIDRPTATTPTAVTPASADNSAADSKIDSAEDSSVVDSSKNSADERKELPAVFVGGLAWETTEAGFAFVHYLSIDAVNICCRPGFEHVIDGKRVDVKIKQPNTSSVNKFQQTSSDPAAMSATSPPASYAYPPQNSYSEEGGYSAGGGAEGQPQIMTGANLRDAPGMNVGRKVFVGGLSQDVREADLRDMMKHFGTIVDVVVMMDRHTKRSRGYGFVTFSSQAEAENASKNNRQLLGDKYCEVKLYVPGAKGHGFGERAPRYPMNPMQQQQHGGYQQYQQSGNDWNRHRSYGGGGGGRYQNQYYDPNYQQPSYGQPRGGQWMSGNPPPQSSQGGASGGDNQQQQQQQQYQNSNTQQQSSYSSHRDNSGGGGGQYGYSSSSSRGGRRY